MPRLFVLALIVTIASLFSLSYPVLAQVNETETTNNLSSNEQNRISQLVNDMTDRFQNLNNRLQNVANRMLSRSQKLAATGINTTATEGYVSSAQEKLQQASQLAVETDSILQQTLVSTEPKSQWPTLRNHIANHKLLLQDAHNDLLRALFSLKLELQSDNNATSSDNITNSDNSEQTAE